MSALGEAWFSALGEPLGEAERSEVAAGRDLVERGRSGEEPTGKERAARHPFLRKYALYCGGRWPLGVYDGRFAIF